MYLNVYGIMKSLPVSTPIQNIVNKGVNIILT